MEPFRYPLVLAGPKRGGRRTLGYELSKKYPKKFEVAISHTTRKKRDYEEANNGEIFEGEFENGFA